MCAQPAASFNRDDGAVGTCLEIAASEQQMLTTARRSAATAAAEATLLVSLVEGGRGGADVNEAFTHLFADAPDFDLDELFARFEAPGADPANWIADGEMTATRPQPRPRRESPAALQESVGDGVMNLADPLQWLSSVAVLESVIVRHDAYGLEGPDGTRTTERGPVNEALLGDHLRGTARIGTLILAPDDTVICACIDIDADRLPRGMTPEDVATRIAARLTASGLAPLIEISKRRGYHLWVFFASPTPAWMVRAVLLALVNDAGLPQLEVFPKQNFLCETPEGLGSFVWLPWHGGSTQRGRTLFGRLTPTGWAAFPDQLQAFHTIPRAEPSVVEQCVRERGITKPAPSPRPSATAAPCEGGPTPLISLDSLRVSQRIKDLIVAGWDGEAAGRYRSRSEVDEAVIAALLRYGHTDQEIRDVFGNRAWRVGQKFREPGNGDRYLDHSITNARAFLQTATPQSGSGSDRPSPPICVQNHDLAQVSDAVWRAIQDANVPPTFFRYGGNLCRLEADEDGLLVPHSLAAAGRMSHLLARVITWYKEEDGRRSSAYPPPRVIQDVLAHTDPPLPVLNRIVYAPAFAPDGTLQTEPGYSPAARSFLIGNAAQCVPPVPEHPSRADVDRARTLILDELLVDFPFVSAADKAHAVALLLLPFVRDLVAGPTPLHLIEKPTSGTGATLLVEVNTHIVMGKKLRALTEGSNEEEWRKRITAKLLDAPTFFLIDNVRARLQSAALSAAITTEIWEDRVLGQSQIVRAPVRCTWVATANNPILSDEIARRSIRIRLDAGMEQPWLRQEFRHPLPEWAIEHRGELLWAALTLVRAWLDAGRPRWTGTTLGTFEAWSAVLGGILQFARIPGFLGNLDALYRSADPATAFWRSVVPTWWRRYHDRPVGVAELWNLLPQRGDDPLGLGVGDGTDRAQRTRFGMRLAAQRDRIVAGYRIEAAGTRQGAQYWRLRRVTGKTRPGARAAK